MKHNLLRSIFIISIFSFLTGCIATHSGSMSGSASLDSPNFVYKNRNILGEAVATYVLGIGGDAKQSLILEAKRNMLRENPLLKNQALANVSVSYKTTNFLGILYTVVKCDVSADIVEFGPVQTDFTQSATQDLTSIIPVKNSSISDNKKPEINSSMPNKIEDNKKPEIVSSGSIIIGDKVNIVNYFGGPFSEPIQGKVIDIMNGKFIVEYTTSNNKTKQVKVSKSNLEKIK